MTSGSRRCSPDSPGPGSAESLEPEASSEEDICMATHDPQETGCSIVSTSAESHGEIDDSCPAPGSDECLTGGQSSYRCEPVGRRMRSTKLRHAWMLRLGEQETRIELVHSKLSGKKQVLVDGEEVFTTRQRCLDWSWEHTSQVRISLRSENGNPELWCKEPEREAVAVSSTQCYETRETEQMEVPAQGLHRRPETPRKDRPASHPTEPGSRGKDSRSDASDITNLAEDVTCAIPLGQLAVASEVTSQSFEADQAPPLSAPGHLSARATPRCGTSASPSPRARDLSCTAVERCQASSMSNSELVAQAENARLQALLETKEAEIVALQGELRARRSSPGRESCPGGEQGRGLFARAREHLVAAVPRRAPSRQRAPAMSSSNVPQGTVRVSDAVSSSPRRSQLARETRPSVRAMSAALPLQGSCRANTPQVEGSGDGRVAPRVSFLPPSPLPEPARRQASDAALARHMSKGTWNDPRLVAPPDFLQPLPEENHLDNEELDVTHRQVLTNSPNRCHRSVLDEPRPRVPIDVHCVRAGSIPPRRPVSVERMLDGRVSCPQPSPQPQAPPQRRSLVWTPRCARQSPARSVTPGRQNLQSHQSHPNPHLASQPPQHSPHVQQIQHHMQHLQYQQQVQQQQPPPSQSTQAPPQPPPQQPPPQPPQGSPPPHVQAQPYCFPRSRTPGAQVASDRIEGAPRNHRPPPPPAQGAFPAGQNYWFGFCGPEGQRWPASPGTGPAISGPPPLPAIPPLCAPSAHCPSGQRTPVQSGSPGALPAPGAPRVGVSPPIPRPLANLPAMPCLGSGQVHVGAL
uniref:Uncharacterized protein n=1 Tax=Noctiluca scintillans TaxID=2966 RepID=A0A7S1EYG3_NOCSC|mmetsp:Transcript_17118/g.46392  ORF Transcript_17118/g.46392 Transcript_17118/m.46392 type:complete len:805 (+) Transcript_17118:27-2441(+)